MTNPWEAAHHGWASLFLAALLDTLGTGVKRTLATGLGGHLLASLLVCCLLVLRSIDTVETRLFRGQPYQRASSRGRPCHRRRSLWLASWLPSRAWPCRLLMEGLVKESMVG